MSIEWPTPTVLFAIYFCFIISIISFLTTLLAIAAYFHSANIRKNYQNVLMLNLLVNALIYLIYQIIYSGYGAIRKNSNILSIEWICNFQGFISLFCCGMEIYTLMCIALERYFAILKQQPLTYNQIIGLLVFGYIWEALTASFPLWNSSFYYSLSGAKFYCTYSYSDRSQLLPALCAAFLISFCISIISYCYLQIYCFCKTWKEAPETKLVSIIQPNESLKMNDKSQQKEKELRILWTTILLVGWTFLGWTPMLLLVTYQIITGNDANVYWDIVGAVMVLVAICGDSIILLIYDKRWKSSLQEMKIKLRNILS